MWWIPIIIFIINGLFCEFSLNIAKYKGKLDYLFQEIWYYIHSIIFFLLSMTSIYLYEREYLFEAFFTFFILGVLPGLASDNIPKIIKKKNRLVTYVLILSMIVCGYIFYNYQ